MAQSLSKIYLHIVFSTRNRTNLLPPERLAEVHAYIGGIINNKGCQSIMVGGTTNHVHILCEISSTLSAADLIKHVKGSSSRWIKQYVAYPEHGFSWQNGYAVFSVSQSNTDTVVRYIAHQEEHHQRYDYKAEVLGLLKRHKVEYDEEFLWT